MEDDLAPMADEDDRPGDLTRANRLFDDRSNLVEPLGLKGLGMGRDRSGQEENQQAQE